MSRGKRYLNALKLIDKNTIYSPQEACKLVRETATAGFDETIEVHLRLGVDSRHADQLVRGAVVLPHGTGKSVRVMAFAKDAKAEEATKAGADYVGGKEFADKIMNDNWMDFDVVIATPDMMGIVGRLGKVLGPRGLMPSPKAGTITPEIGQAVEDAKKGKIEYRLDKSNIIHCIIGKKSFTEEMLYDNLETLLEAVIKSRPAAAKGKYIQSCTITAAMGPGIAVEPVFNKTE